MEMTKTRNNTTRMLAEAGIMMALAQVLSMVTFFKMPQGGSVTAASMVPILLFIFRWGVKPGILVGTGFGFMQLIFGGYVLVPIQGALDYPIAYACLAIAGFASRYFRNIGSKDDVKSYVMVGIATFLAIFARCMFHVLSGVIFFSEYAGETNPWLYSIGYNGTFLAAEFVLSLIVLYLLAKPISKLD